MCREQQALQNKRAANAELENVRAVAAAAAMAWGNEAIAAERREARQARSRLIAEMTALEKQRASNDDELSSDGDRGLAGN
jgi:hypothetical protein